MRVTTIGHAGLRVETAQATVLVDPWLSPHGAFQASWFQFPSNQHLVSDVLLSPDAVVLSHEHLDHLDPWTLARVPAEIPVIVPTYPSHVLHAKITAARARPIVELAAWQRYDIDGLRVFFVPETSPMNHDAAVVVEGDGHVLLDLNDARLSPAQLRSIREFVDDRIDMVALQGSGASWHPMCYEIPAGRKAEISREKRKAKLAYASLAANSAEATTVLPIAGPPCFLDPELFVHNDEMRDGVFPDQHEVAKWLRGRAVRGVEVMLPGDTWDIADAALTADPVWSDFDWSDHRDYLAHYAECARPAIEAVIAAHPEPDESLAEPFRAYFDELLAMSPYFNRRVDMRVGFDIVGPGGGAWTVDFREGHEGVDDGLDGCAVRYRFASRWLPPILSGSVPWEDFFLSLRFSAWRDPDVHNDHLLGVLKFATPTALAAVEAYESNLATKERITVEADGQKYSVQRYCPHAGADLLDTCELLPGRRLRCLNHYYEYDLDSGQCLNGTSDPLSTERL